MNACFRLKVQLKDTDLTANEIIKLATDYMLKPNKDINTLNKRTIVPKELVDGQFIEDIVNKKCKRLRYLGDKKLKKLVTEEIEVTGCIDSYLEGEIGEREGDKVEVIFTRILTLHPQRSMDPPDVRVWVDIKPMK